MPTFTPTAGQNVFFQERSFILYEPANADQWLAYETQPYPMGDGMVLLNVSDMSPGPPDESSITGSNQDA